MRVYIKESTGKQHDIKIPTGLALNRVTAGIISNACQKNGINISKKQILELMKAFKCFKKHHLSWKLLEVYDADGEHVEIIV